jgi:hypothetical protein
MMRELSYLWKVLGSCLVATRRVTAKGMLGLCDQMIIEMTCGKEDKKEKKDKDGKLRAVGSSLQEP